ncbi:SCA7-domain-containing protein, partial [Nadsonia fulvescens var. elongata DSM 6958]
LSGLKDTKSQGGTKRKAEYANGDTLEDTPSGAVNTITTNGTIANGNGSTDTLVDTTSDAKPQLKKKKKEKTKVKTIPKSKLPVDVEKQCGVPLPNGLLCARSLTCKTHSMGAKRAVTGRSAPYDVLLANYQKRNQIKQALLSTELQLANENEQFKDSVPLSPEEEFLQVMQGVKQSIPVPVERQIIMPARLRHGFFPFNVDDPSNLHFLKPASLSRAQAMQQVTMKQREQHLRMLQQQQPQ